MPDDNKAQAPKMSTRLWSQEVALARAGGALDTLKPEELDLANREVAYEFSSGRKFYAKRNPYA
jgi:hypothetical protein